MKAQTSTSCFQKMKWKVRKIFRGIGIKLDPFCSWHTSCVKSTGLHCGKFVYIEFRFYHHYFHFHLKNWFPSFSFIVQFRYFLLFSLTFLLPTEDVYGGWRRARKFIRKVANVAKTVATVHTVAKVAAGVIGKRYTDDQVRNTSLFNSMYLLPDL